VVLVRQEKLAEAEALNREALAMRQKLLGPEHPDVADSLMRVAFVLRKQGKFAEAEARYRQELALLKKLHGKEHAEVARSLKDLAVVLADEKELVEAEALHREALASRKRLLGPDHADITDSLEQLAFVLSQQDKIAGAETVLREALAMGKRLDPQKPADAWSLNCLAGVMKKQGKLAETAALLREAAEQGDTEAQCSLAQMYARGEGVAKDTAAAAKWNGKAAEQYRKGAEGGDTEGLNDAAWLLATCPQAEVRDGRAAVTYAEKAVAATNRKQPFKLGTLAAAYAETGEFAKAAAIQKEAMTLLQDDQQKREFEGRLKLYEAQRPYREE